MEILHNLDLFVSRAQSLCLLDQMEQENLQYFIQFMDLQIFFQEKLKLMEEKLQILHQQKNLKSEGIAYILQDNSVFPDMTVEENLLMGGFIKDKTEESFEEAEKVLQKYERLKNRRNQPAKVLSGGERRLLEISRALSYETISSFS